MQGPFGADIGGISDSILSISPDSANDSWLTIGITDGQFTSLSTTGIDFSSWTSTIGLLSEGAVFFMDPNDGPSGSVVVAQVTLPTSALPASASMTVQGRQQVGPDWDQHVEWMLEP